MFRSILFFSVILGAGTAAAQPVRLTSDALKETMPGSLFELDTPLGTTVPVRFTADGLMSGDAKELAPMLGSAKDRGRWWVSNDQLCYKWFRWFEAEARCLVIRRDGARVYWTRDDGESGTGTLVEEGTRLAQAAPTASTGAAREAQLPTSSITKSAPAPVARNQRFVTAAAAASLTQPPPAKPAQPPANERPTEARGPDTGNDNFNPARRRPVKPAISQAAKAPPKAQPSKQPRKEPSTVQVRKEPPTARQEAPTARQEERLALSVPPRPAERTSKPAPATPYAKREAPARVQTATFRVFGVDRYDVLNVRSGPSQYHHPVGMIPPTGRGIVLIGRCREDWCPIKHRDTVGWVNRYYITQDVQH